MQAFAAEHTKTYVHSFEIAAPAGPVCTGVTGSGTGAVDGPRYDLRGTPHPRPSSYV